MIKSLLAIIYISVLLVGYQLWVAPGVVDNVGYSFLGFTLESSDGVKFFAHVAIVATLIMLGLKGKEMLLNIPSCIRTNPALIASTNERLHEVTGSHSDCVTSVSVKGFIFPEVNTGRWTSMGMHSSPVEIAVSRKAYYFAIISAPFFVLWRSKLELLLPVMCSLVLWKTCI